MYSSSTELPTLQSKYCEDTETRLKTHLEMESDVDSQDDDFSDKDEELNEAQLRQKVLTCPLDKEVSVLSKRRNIGYRKPLMKSSSLPTHLGEEPVIEDVSSVFICSTKDDAENDSTKDYSDRLSNSPSNDEEQNSQTLNKHSENSLEQISQIKCNATNTAIDSAKVISSNGSPSQFEKEDIKQKDQEQEIMV